MEAAPAGAVRLTLEAYATRTGRDPREAGPDHAAYVVTPVTIQAWREYPELAGRTLMRDGRWLT